MKWGLNMLVKKLNRVSTRRVSSIGRSSVSALRGAKKVVKLALKASIGMSLGLGQLIAIALIGK
jgi:hypothetical protein